MKTESTKTPLATQALKTAQHLSSFFPRKSLASSEASLPQRSDTLAYEIARDADTILEVQRFRAKVFSQAYQLYFDSGIDQDRYDHYSAHVLVRDLRTGHIVACTRIITPDAKKYLGKYYSECEFDLSDFLRGKKDVYEIGRTCVDESYRGGDVLGVLWMGMVPLVLQELKAKYLIGTVSINLARKPEKMLSTEAYMAHKARQADYPSLKVFDTEKFLFGRDVVFADVWQTEKKKKEKLAYRKKDVPSLIKHYRRMGAVFSREAYHDAMFNCADYFLAVEVNKKLLMKLNLVCTVMNWKKKLKVIQG